MGRSSLSSGAIAASAQLQVSEMRCNVKAPGIKFWKDVKMSKKELAVK